MTLVFPLLAIKGIVTDYREICIAGVTLPKGGEAEEVVRETLAALWVCSTYNML